MSDDGAQILAEARRLLADPHAPKTSLTPLFRALHRLAEDQYAPAQEFFDSLLTFPNPVWRYEAMRDLGHYPCLGDDTLARVRESLVWDPDPDIRISAASILGEQLDRRDSWPDWGLEQAIEQDPVIQVRSSAFRALLLTAAVPYDIILASASIENEHPSLASAKEIVAAARNLP
ncbi:MAG: hypothetical protein U0232_29330 [Thermomicrobiales bacterium]